MNAQTHTYSHEAPLPQPKRVTHYSLQEFVELGFQLIRLKSACNHGQFSQRTKELGFRPAESPMLMAIARKFHGQSDQPILEAAGNISKLRELLTLDEEEIDALKAGGEARGITLRSLKSMTITQVRLTLRGTTERQTASLSVDEARMLREYRQRAKEAQDVPDKTAGPYWEPCNDLFSSRCSVTL